MNSGRSTLWRCNLVPQAGHGGIPHDGPKEREGCSRIAHLLHRRRCRPNHAGVEDGGSLVMPERGS